MALKFGAFMAPFHALGEDPTTTFWRNLDLISWLDELGIDEAWVGEHHSGGWSPIAAPEVFLAAAAERTQRIKLGTGVVSLPYHHPLSVAERMIQLDHQSHGRALFGMGAGVSPADAYMMGISPSDQRRMMAESVDALVALLHGTEPVTRKTDWFELRDARTHLRPYSKPCFDMAVASAGSPRGMRLAGQYGLHSLTFAGRPGMADPPLAELWQAAEEEAASSGKTVDRANWRVAICVHVAETKREALEQTRRGMSRWYQEYVRDTFGATASLPEDREADAAAEDGSVIIDSVEGAIRTIEQKLEDSGGFGTLLVNTHDWATRENVKRSFELIARYIKPHFNGSLDSLRASQRWVAENRGDFSAQAREAAQAAAKK